MGVERVALEHHGNVTVLGVEVIDDLTVDGNLATADVLQTCQHAKQGGLAAARGTDQHDEFAIMNIKTDAVNDLGLAKRLLDLVKCDECHGTPIIFR